MWAVTHAGPLAGLVGVAVGLTLATTLAARRVMRLTVVTGIALLAGVAAGAARSVPVVTGPLHSAAASGAAVTLDVVVRQDPVSVVRTGGLDWNTTTARTVVVDAGVPLLVVLPASVGEVVPGERIRVSGRLAPAAPGRSYAAVLRARSATVLRSPPRYQWAASVVRARLQHAVAELPAQWRGLLPGLVLGDTSHLAPALAADMRVAGLSHLTAVSGANVAVLVSLVSACAARAPRRTRFVLVVIAISAFVVLVRPSPSVVRAAVMGALAAYAVMRRERAAALQLLSAAVLVLVILDPWLSVSYGFALSVLATGSLVLWATRFAAAMRGPRWAVDAFAATVCAQLAVLPVLVALGNHVTLASVPANLVAVPLATVAMLSGLGVAALAVVWPAAAALAVWVPGAAAGAIAWIAGQAAAADWLELPWPSGRVGVGCAVMLVALVATSARLWPRSDDAARSASVIVVTAVTLVVLTRPSPVPAAWPPVDWAVVSCDVGQGDATVVRVGPASAVVVDAGPEPRAVDQCLRELRVRSVPFLVLTHFHADHVGGLAGVLRHRNVGTVYVTALADPLMMARWVDAELGTRGTTVMAFPGRFTVGEVTFQCVWPRRFIHGQGSDANNASVALLVRTRGASFLLPGDAEPAAQDAMLAGIGPVDVLKVAHHGSAYQSPAFANRTHPHFAVMSVGEGNDYGHPSPLTIALYQSVGSVVLRTDRDGSIAFRVASDGTVTARGHT